MVENTFDEETYYGGVDGRRMRSRRGALGDQNIVENGLLMRIYVGGSIIPTRSRYATTEAEIEIFLQGGILYALRDSSYVLRVMQLMFWMLIPEN